jgi:predicted enzyme related to lactoylglutathione lyase
MLKGMSTITMFADDLAAAERWYSELLGMQPYFRSENVGRGPGYVEYRLGDYQHELGILDRRFASPKVAASGCGAVCFWHVDDLGGSLERLLARGATLVEGITEQGPGFITASVIDPFGNVLGIMHNQHYLDVLGARHGAA